MRKVSRNANFYLAVLIAAIFAVALIFAISSGNTVKILKSGTPEATVQKYLQALNDGRNEDAASLFASTSKCSAEDIDRAYIDQNAQVLLDKTVIGNNNSAIVYISIQRNDAPLMADPYTETQDYRLVKEDGIWKIAGIPWPLYDCGVNTK
jgi:hypothetical protein